MSPQPKADLAHQRIPGSDVGAMTMDGFCRWACIGKTKAYAEIKAGRLQIRKIGSKTIVLLADAEAYLHSLPTASES